MSEQWVLVVSGYSVCGLTWVAYAFLLRRGGRVGGHRRGGGP